MMGERHFAARERLLGCFERIDALAAATGTLGAADASGAREQLARPVRVVLLGEVNAGKSTLLNALCGENCAAVSPLPHTRRITGYAAAGAVRDRSAGGKWEWHEGSSAFFRGIELIDTPGTNSDQREALWHDLPLLKQADARLLVFPASNPWTAATWELLVGLSDGSLERTWLVVQQADLKSREDLRVIAGHMQTLCLKKVGRELPIVAVAARGALAKKLGAGQDADAAGWDAWQAFEEDLNREVFEA